MLSQETKQYGIKGQYEINISNNIAAALKKSNVNMITNKADFDSTRGLVIISCGN